jgi:glycine dehydrogenase subunit 2
MAVLNANYMKARIGKVIPLSHNGNYLHEIVVSLRKLKEETGTNAFDVSKALIDNGFHPPTIYFPLIVQEAMMIEPTETESLEDIDAFIDTLIEIVRQVREGDSLCEERTHHTQIGRVDEVNAARKLILHW